MSEKEFLEQVRDNQGIIFKLVGLYAADEEERKDLYQEILLQTWKAWPGFRGDSKFSTWLYRICLNTIFTQKRKPSTYEFKELTDEAEEVPLYTPAIAEYDLQHIQWAIRRLAETDRALISLHLDGYSNTEIGSLLGITNNSVAVKIHRIKKQLVHFLKQV